MGERVRRTISLGDRTSQELDHYAEEYGMPVSAVVERALQEFLDGGQRERMESKLDRILNAVEGKDTSSREQPEKKEISPDERRSSHGTTSPSIPAETQTTEVSGGEVDSDVDINDTSDDILAQGPLELGKKNQEGRANRMFNYLILNHPDEPLKKGIMKKAIKRIVSGSEHSYDTYLPRIIERLHEYGYCHDEKFDLWYPSREVFEEKLRGRITVPAEELQTLADTADPVVQDIYDNIEDLNEAIAYAHKHDVDISDMDEEIADAIAAGKERAREIEGESEVF